MVFQPKHYKTEVLEKPFCFFLIPNTHFYIAHTLFLQHTKMFDLDDTLIEHNEEHNLKWPYVPDYPYRMLILRCYGSGHKCIP